MKFIRLFFILYTFTFISCNSHKVVSFNNPSYANRVYQTYKIITIPDKEVSNKESSIHKKVSVAIHQELTGLNMKSFDRNSELVVRYEFRSMERDDSRVIRNSRTSRFNNLNNNFNPNYANISKRSITESILLVDVFDRKTKKLVWQASIDLNVSNKKYENIDILLTKAVSALFQTYQAKD